MKRNSGYQTIKILHKLSCLTRNASLDQIIRKDISYRVLSASSIKAPEDLQFAPASDCKSICRERIQKEAVFALYGLYVRKWKPIAAYFCCANQFVSASCYRCSNVKVKASSRSPKQASFDRARVTSAGRTIGRMRGAWFRNLLSSKCRLGPQQVANFFAVTPAMINSQLLVYVWFFYRILGIAKFKVQIFQACSKLRPRIAAKASKLIVSHYGGWIS